MKKGVVVVRGISIRQSDGGLKAKKVCYDLPGRRPEECEPLEVGKDPIENMRHTGIVPLLMVSSIVNVIVRQVAMEIGRASCRERVS